MLVRYGLGYDTNCGTFGCVVGGCGGGGRLSIELEMEWSVFFDDRHEKSEMRREQITIEASDDRITVLVLICESLWSWYVRTGVVGGVWIGVRSTG